MTLPFCCCCRCLVNATAPLPLVGWTLTSAVVPRKRRRRFEAVLLAEAVNMGIETRGSAWLLLPTIVAAPLPLASWLRCERFDKDACLIINKQRTVSRTVLLLSDMSAVELVDLACWAGSRAIELSRAQLCANDRQDWTHVSGTIEGEDRKVRPPLPSARAIVVAGQPRCHSFDTLGLTC